jgi:hypothetical protein
MLERGLAAVNALRIALTWALCFGPAAALAQTAAARPDPADPRVSSPLPPAESAFAGYRSFKEEPPADWRAVNDAVQGLRGHAGHIRDAAAPTERAAPSADQPAPKPPAAGAKHAY